MISLSAILDKDLRNTVLISIGLHACCLALLGFSFVDKLNFSMDLGVDFLGPILKQADILVPAQEKDELFGKKPVTGVFLLHKADLTESHYHLSANKPHRKPGSLFLEKKISAKNSYLFPESATTEPAESVGKSPGWDKDLKLKIE